MIAWRAITWSEDALGPALLALARATGLTPRVTDLSSVEPPRDAADVDDWILGATDQAGLHADAMECAHAELPDALARIAPGLVRIRLEQERRYLAVVRSTRRRLLLIDASGATAHVSIEAVRDVLTRDVEALPHKRVDYLLETARIDRRRARRARGQLLGLYLSETRIAGMWTLRLDPGAPFHSQLRRSRVLRRAALALALSVVQVSITLYGWVLLGGGALAGAIEPGWLLGWMLACLSALPFQVATLWLSGGLLNDTAALLKQRLLCGALRLEPDHIRARGSGRLLAMVSESEAIEGAGLTAAFGLALALVQLASAFVITGLGAGGAIQGLLLLAWCGVVVGLMARAFRLRARWTDQRFELANTLVEHVLGNRTRIAQQPREHWHMRDDLRLERYLTRSQTLDVAQRRLAVLPGRGWFIIGFAGLLAGGWLQHASTLELAIAIGGVLQAYAALSALGTQATAAGNALIAWRQIRELFHAAADLPSPGHPAAALQRTPPATPPVVTTDVRSPVLEVRDVSFAYRAGVAPALRACTLSVNATERILLTGPSGGGKSTLAALLAGLRSPQSGQILLHGLDRSTLGSAAWRRRIASAPQFHENHILSGSLAFNLLMGRAWPANDADRQEADALCRELGLGPTLDRMPSGLNQMIGETGWQLSHGERSRLFLARALLQRADLVILDESFGALDPITLETCMRTVLRRAPALVVIAHP
jgi:ATP-binding cassette, subfamily B, bacterial